MLPSPLIKLKCSAPGCQSVYMPGCEESFFAFPKEPARCQKWIHFCGLENRYRVARDVPNTVKLCSKHFNKSESYTNGKRRFLIRTAVPTIHNNGTATKQESSKTPRAANSISWAPITLSPLHSPMQQHKVMRTYARRNRLGNSSASSASSISSPSAILPYSLRDFKMDLKDAIKYNSVLMMNLKEETLWQDQTSAENKLMAEYYYDKDAELKHNIISFASIFTIKSENNIGIYNPDNEMNTKIEIKDEPNTNTDLHDEIKDTDFWKDWIDQDFPVAEPPG